MPPSSPSPPIPSFQPPSAPIPAVLPCSTQSPPNPSSPSPSNADVASSSIIPTSHSELTSAPTESSGELGGEEFDPQLFWQDATFGHEYFSMGATERDRLAYDNLLGRTAFDDEGESFPFTSGATFGDDDGADLRISSEHHQCLQPELEGSQLPLLPSLGSDQIDKHGINADLLSVVPRSSFSTDVDGELTPVLMVNSELQKRQHRAIEGLQGEGESVIADDDGGEDHERRTSKRARKPPASRAVVAVGWLPSAVQYLTDTNLGLEWVDLLAAWQALEAQISQNGSPAKVHLLISILLSGLISCFRVDWVLSHQDLRR